MLPIIAVLGLLSFFNGIESAALRASPDTNIDYQQMPDKLKKFVAPEMFNAYNKLSTEKKNQISEIANQYKEDEDKNQFLHNAIKISNRFGASVLRAYYSKIYIVQDTITEAENARMSNQAEKAYQLAIALMSKDQQFIDKALAEARTAD